MNSDRSQLHRNAPIQLRCLLVGKGVSTTQACFSFCIVRKSTPRHEDEFVCQVFMLVTHAFDPFHTRGAPTFCGFDSDQYPVRPDGSLDDDVDLSLLSITPIPQHSTLDNGVAFRSQLRLNQEY